jgi:nitrogenase iron protein NifH
VRNVVICGKGGIGKSTVTTNTAALLAASGLRVLQVGCDPKRDSCARHLDAPPGTLMDALVARGHLAIADVVRLVTPGRTGVDCIEAGGPEPGIGCAGRAIALLLELMAQAPDLSRYDVRLFDLVGDVVCGGFAAPLRTGKDTQVYLVVAGELLALYAANNIARGIANLNRRGGGRLAGVVCNLRGAAGERELVQRFAERLGTRVVSWVPRDAHVVAADAARRTLAEAFPGAPAVEAFTAFAAAIGACAPEQLVTPRPLSDAELEALCAEHLTAPAPAA